MKKDAVTTFEVVDKVTGDKLYMSLPDEPSGQLCWVKYWMIPDELTAGYELVDLDVMKVDFEYASSRDIFVIGKWNAWVYRLAERIRRRLYWPMLHRLVRWGLFYHKPGEYIRWHDFLVLPRG